MGMQVHFNVADIPEACRVHRHADQDLESDDDHVDTYIVVDPESLYFSTTRDHTRAWADIGSMSNNAMNALRFLITHRIPFNAS